MLESLQLPTVYQLKVGNIFKQSVINEIIEKCEKRQKNAGETHSK